MTENDPTETKQKMFDTMRRATFSDSAFSLSICLIYTVNVCANELANRKIGMVMGYEFKSDFFFFQG